MTPRVDSIGIALALLASGAVVLGGCMGRMAETAPDGVDGGFSFVPECDQEQPRDSNGYHFPGDDCLGCHRQGGLGPPFSIGGTAYLDVAGTAPAAGVTIHVVDATGTDFAMVTASNGNFWSTDSMSFPAATFASLCPDVEPMYAPLAETDASCNRAGCHGGGFRVASP